ncbi:esterase/lipase [Reticulomyxa filosa]|uniref:Esterase/lipase n=1 Tax=Reticulomyxa filosa TaxID=46433 RepID=X6MA89_RETFI|nr:esterase/lipase [Reticulomyxa filosa]|eukprot:ETO10903.1 esterase/lipase [Reticulomyxa filosa]
MVGLDLESVGKQMSKGTPNFVGGTTSKIMRDIKYELQKQLENKHGIEHGGERAMILENVDFSDVSHLKWRCNVKVLREKENNIHDFPLNDIDPGHLKVFRKPSLFIGGDQSARLTTPRYVKEIEKLFGNYHLIMLNGDHFIHRTHSAQVIQLIADYTFHHAFPTHSTPPPTVTINLCECHINMMAFFCCCVYMIKISLKK